MAVLGSTLEAPAIGWSGASPRCRRRRCLPPLPACRLLACPCTSSLLPSPPAQASIAKGAQPLKVPAPASSKPAGRTFRQAWRRTAGELSEAEQRRAVEQALEVFRSLPPSSSYAQHRIRVLQKALQLLDKAARWVLGGWVAAQLGFNPGSRGSSAVHVLVSHGSTFPALTLTPLQ